MLERTDNDAKVINNHGDKQFGRSDPPVESRKSAAAGSDPLDRAAALVSANEEHARFERQQFGSFKVQLPTKKDERPTIQNDQDQNAIGCQPQIDAESAEGDVR